MPYIPKMPAVVQWEIFWTKPIAGNIWATFMDRYSSTTLVWYTKSWIRSLEVTNLRNSWPLKRLFGGMRIPNSFGSPVEKAKNPTNRELLFDGLAATIEKIMRLGWRWKRVGNNDRFWKNKSQFKKEENPANKLLITQFRHSKPASSNLLQQGFRSS